MEVTPVEAPVQDPPFLQAILKFAKPRPDWPEDFALNHAHYGEFYRQRRDKEWSLTDCISFVVMQEEQLTEALTADRHFEQAGFKPLLA